MNGNLIIGSATMMICVVIQCLGTAVMLRELWWLDRRGHLRAAITSISLVLIVVVAIILASNLVQIALWALLFLALGEFGDFATSIYHSMVNFATLGYGDLVMSAERRTLGALEALNGVLMVGLTRPQYLVEGSMERAGEFGAKHTLELKWSQVSKVIRGQRRIGNRANRGSGLKLATLES